MTSTGPSFFEGSNCLAAVIRGRRISRFTPTITPCSRGRNGIPLRGFMVRLGYFKLWDKERLKWSLTAALLHFLRYFSFSIPLNFFIFCYLLSRDDEETTGHFHFRPGSGPPSPRCNQSGAVSVHKVLEPGRERSSFLRGTAAYGKGEIRKLKNFSRNPKRPTAGRAGLNLRAEVQVV